MPTTIAPRYSSAQVWFHFLAPILVGCLLLASAGLKADQLLVDEASQDGLFGSRWFLIAMVEFELLLGMWLFSGMSSNQCRQVVLAVFVVFAIVTLQKGLSGESSCGCFGRLEISPWWTLVLDLLVLSAMWVWSPLRITKIDPNEVCDDDSEGVNWRAFISAGAVLVIGITISVQMLSVQQATLTQDGTISEDCELVILEPEKWIGHMLPIAKHIDIGDQLREGQWILVLFHHDCPKCQEALPKYELLALQLISSGDSTRIAIVEVPPYGGVPIQSGHVAANVYGRLSDRQEWFVQAPVEIVVENGTVTAVSTELPRLESMIMSRLDDGQFSAALQIEKVVFQRFFLLCRWENCLRGWSAAYDVAIFRPGMFG